MPRPVALPLALALAANASAQGGDRPAPAPSLSPTMPGAILLEERTLANGIRVVVANRAGSGIVACRLLVKSGLADDPPGAAGLALYLARLLDQGTQTLGVRDAEKERESRRSVENFEVTYRSFFREAMEQFRRGEGPDPTDPTSRPAALQKLREVLAALEERHLRDLVPGEANALYARAGASERAIRVGLDGTVIAATLPAARLEVFFALESDRLRGAVFRDLAGTRDRIRREWLALRDEDSTFRARDAFRSLLWAGHPYGAPAPGSDALDGISQEYLERERQRRLAAPNLAVVLAGDVAAAAAFDLAERYLGSIPAGPPREEPPARATRAAGAVRMETEAWAPASVSIAWTAPGFVHRDHAALLVLGEALAARRHARVALDGARDGALFVATALANTNENLAKAEEALRDALQSARAARLSPEEIGRARRSALARLLDDWRDLGGFADLLARAEGGGSPKDLSEVARRLAAVTPEDVQAAAREWLPDAGRATLVVRRAHAAAMPKAEAPPPPKAPPASQPAAPPASQPAAPAPEPAAPPASQPASQPASRPAGPAATQPLPGAASRPAPESAPASAPAPGGTP